MKGSFWDTSPAGDAVNPHRYVDCGSRLQVSARIVQVAHERASVAQIALISLASSTAWFAPRRATASMAWPSLAVANTQLGKMTRSIGNRGLVKA